MALIIEDGTLVHGCNSYVTFNDADSYLTVRALWDVTETGGDTSKKESALIRAFDALNTLTWKGDLPVFGRVTAWPRQNVPLPEYAQEQIGVNYYLPSDVIPDAVKQAQIELAALIYNDTCNPLTPIERGGKYTSKSDSESVDVLSESHSVTYASDAPIETYLPAVYGILKPYLQVIPGQSGLQCGLVGKQ